VTSSSLISPGISWYEETAGERPEYPSLDGDRRADVVIVGGGFTGLSAAAHLAKAGANVALVEAHRIGDGASGRNGGQLGTGHRAWAEDWVTLQCGSCGRRDQWPRPELGCPCGTVLRIAVAGQAATAEVGTGAAPGPPRRRRPFQPVTIRTARDAVTAAAVYLRWLGCRDIRIQRLAEQGMGPAILHIANPTLFVHYCRPLRLGQGGGYCLVGLAGYRLDRAQGKLAPDHGSDRQQPLGRRTEAGEARADHLG